MDRLFPVLQQCVVVKVVKLDWASGSLGQNNFFLETISLAAPGRAFHSMATDGMNERI